MKDTLKQTSSMLLLLLFSGCTEIPDPTAQSPGLDNPRPVARPGTIGELPPANATTPEDFDTTSANERLAATAQPPSSGETEIGRTVASLGNPADPGFWLQTPLVSIDTPGRVVDPATGASVSVELIAIPGPKTAGSRISLAALRLLGIPLTGLPELIVFSR